MKIKDIVYYDRKVCEVIECSENYKNLKYDGGTIGGGVTGAIVINGFELVSLDEIVSGEEVMFLDISFSLNSLNDGTWENFKERFGEIDVVEKHEDYCTFKGMSCANYNNPIFARPKKVHSMEELYKIIGYKFHIKE